MGTGTAEGTVHPVGKPAGFADGTGAAAQFNGPTGVACDGNSNVDVDDNGNNRIRRIVVATGVVSTLAGSTQGSADGPGAAAQSNRPGGVAFDGNGNGNLYVANTNINRIRVVK